jgi:hypothetical protein
MKKLIAIALLLIGCSTDVPDETPSCSGYSDLCAGYPSGIHYELCTDSAGSWWVVGDREYYTIDYMLDQECNF